jgi:hypothetical protein
MQDNRLVGVVRSNSAFSYERSTVVDLRSPLGPMDAGYPRT